MDKKQQLILQKFAENAARIRDTKRLSLNQVASKCKLTNPKVSLIESGRVNVTLLTLFELAEGLGVEPKELLNFQK